MPLIPHSAGARPLPVDMIHLRPNTAFYKRNIQSPMLTAPDSSHGTGHTKSRIVFGWDATSEAVSQLW